MSRYDDYRSSTGTLDSRDRYERPSRGAPVAERPRRVEEDERFEYRLREDDRYGPPARAPDRYYEDDHLVHPPGPLVAHDRRRRDDSPSFRPPRLVRRQSSLDTFDRPPPRRMEAFGYREPSPRRPRVPAPAPPSPRRHSPGRYHEREVYEDIRIAEPDYYGDEEYRELYERDRMDYRPRARSSARSHERIREEKPYPRKGKTRIPRRLVHVHAVLELDYPYKEEDDVVVIQKALSKEQIDEVISLSREFKRRTETQFLEVPVSPPRPRERVTRERLYVDSSPRSSEAFIVEASPSRPRPRSVSVNEHRLSSPVRLVEPREYVGEYDRAHKGQLVLARPRSSENDVSEYIRDLEEETRLLRLERQGGIELTRQRETDTIDNRGNEEEVTEIRRQERRQPNSRVVRAMMATLT